VLQERLRRFDFSALASSLEGVYEKGNGYTQHGHPCNGLLIIEVTNNGAVT